MKAFIKKYFIGCMVVNAIFSILFMTSEKFRKKYWAFSAKLACEAIDASDKVYKYVQKKVNG